MRTACQHYAYISKLSLPTSDSFVGYMMRLGEFRYRSLFALDSSNLKQGHMSKK